MAPSRAIAAALLLAAAAPAAPFEPTGELAINSAGLVGAGASWDAERVVGPQVNLSVQESGGWAGDLRGVDLQLDVTPTRLRGSSVSISLEQKDGALRVEGLFYGQRVRIELTPRALKGRYGECSFDLKRSGPGSYHGEVGCMRTGALPASGSLTLRALGDALSTKPPMPQLALALLAVLPS